MEGKSSKLVELEGLRGAAAFVVVVHHLVLTFEPNLIWNLRSWLSPYGLSDGLIELISRPIEAFSDGPFAVWLFWVMSGIVLSMQWFSLTARSEHARAKRYLKKAFLRRYPRLLLPVLASVVFAYGLTAMGLMRNQELAQVLNHSHPWLGSFYDFTPSILDATKDTFWRTFFCFSETHTYNAVLWTMEKELWGSYLIFVFLALFGRKRWKPFLYAPLAISLCAYKLHWLNAFLIGMVIGDVYTWVISSHREIRERFGSVAKKLILASNSRMAFVLYAAFLIYFIGAKIWDEGYHLFFAVVMCVLVISHERFRSFFSFPLFAYLGKISFGLYLIHLPVICSFVPWSYFLLMDQMGHWGAVSVSVTAAIFLSVGLGHLLYWIADRPSLPFSKKFADVLLDGLDGWHRR